MSQFREAAREHGAMAICVGAPAFSLLQTNTSIEG